ncbi:loganic acid O-methyltransferase-like [Punica granatum]|uniref:Loganic acid O-methyltransferase-like n=1 Tax=Punica granatum TaxID=22663 RepID=A0A218XN82_PUNGR|nr:loganic acid O-methyltransferase-like [Punica granatum]OWM86260.1 hypothetical protein CDL15_Pgr011084 [Punica granatum]
MSMDSSFAMKGGDGPTSYSQNSSFQGSISDQAKALLVKGIQQNIVLPADPNCTMHRTFRIADLGCSVGSNTVACVQTIMEAVKAKYKAEGIRPETLEFQVFFNDQVSSDFNTLFQTLPQDRSYTVAGVPGSFHGKLFPKASMNVMHSSMALHWLSEVPKEVKGLESPAWNKGKITYSESAPEVIEAFSSQFQRDLEEFFKQRSFEMVYNGLLIILMPCRPDGTRPSESLLVQGNECFLGHLLVDMAKEGLVDEALIDSFNMPVFVPTAAEVREVASKIECLSVEVVKKICLPRSLGAITQHPRSLPRLLQAVTEDVVVKHFGPATSDLFYSRLPKKIEERSLASPPPACLVKLEEFENLFMLLRKNAVSN